MGKRKDPLPVKCYYSGKVVDMSYVPDPKMRFSLACHRVRDNAGTGYVVEGEKVYHLSPSSRMAKLVKDEGERARILMEIAALEVPT